MNPLFPRPLDAGYDGRAARIYLGLLAVLTIVPGLIHSYLPDGGAGVIAGMDLAGRKDTVVSLFAWKGATQIPWGLAILAVALRYPTLTPLFLSLLLLEKILLAGRAWVFHPPASGHHPPEHYTTLIFIPLTLLFLLVALRRRA